MSATNYSYLIQNMIWSYSRIKSFEMCPYGFFLRYIKPMPKNDQFFSSYGKFMHRILELVLSGLMSERDAVEYYMENFYNCVKGKAPNPKIFNTYFQQGFEYLKGFSFPYEKIVKTELSSNFRIGQHEFTGIIDCVAKDKSNDIIIVDHKSRALKPVSKRKVPTKNDLEIEEMVKQLYLYSILVKERYGCYPARLEFNCFRNGNLISVDFNEDDLDLEIGHVHSNVFEK